MQVLARDEDSTEVSTGQLPTPWHRRPWPIAGVLFSLYVVLGLLVDVNGHLASDIGGKIPSVEAMAESNSFDPDIGYWFEDADPQGRFHPYFSTKLTSNGTWINSTTLVMLLPARFLWSLGGLRAILLLPMLGSLLAAFAARRLHRRLQPDSDGSSSMWVVGLSSPALVYAFSFWEHSWGLGLMLAGITYVLDTCDENGNAKAALLSGLAFGAAATMRQEALVYGFIGGLAIAATWAWRKQWNSAGRFSALFSVGAIFPVALNALLEIYVLGTSIRTARASATAASSSVSTNDRIFDGLGSTIGAVSSRDFFSWTVTLLLAVSMLGLAVSVWRRSYIRDRPRATLIAVLVSWALWAAIIWLVGPVVVPGSMIAAPLSIFGLVGAVTTPRWRLPLAIGVLGPLPLVLATGFVGFGFAQWGGRYHLASTGVLVVMGLIWLAERDRTVLRVILGCTALVTVVGVVFVVNKTHEVGDAVQQIEQTTTPETVVVWRDSLVAREFGEQVRGRNWLSATNLQSQRELERLLLDQGISSFVWIAPPEFESGFVEFTPSAPQDTLERFEADIIVMTSTSS